MNTGPLSFRPTVACLCTVLLLGLTAQVAQAQAPSQTPRSGEPAPEARLEAVNEAINQIESWLTETRRQRSAEEAQLSNLAREINTIGQSISSNQDRIITLDNELTDQEQQQARLRTQNQSQRRQIAEVLRASYMAGNDSQLKLLLNQQDPAIAQRMMVYFEAFNSNRIEQIQRWQQTLDALAGNSAQLAANRAELDNINARLDEERAELERSQQQRTALITRLTEEMTQRGTELEQLQQDRVNLEALLEEINRIIVEIPAPEDLMPFADSQGKLPWPVRGELLARFGDAYGGGSLQRQGVIIAAEAGSPVRAVHPGRVVFADWMRGSGNLIIVDHGNSYISLYANQQSLAKQSGDWANPGEVLGLSGTDGGTGAPGLHFEIRRNSEALNPVDWLETLR